MAQLMRLSLCLAIFLQPTVGEDDQSCVLQAQKGPPSAKLVRINQDMQGRKGMLSHVELFWEVRFPEAHRLQYDLLACPTVLHQVECAADEEPYEFDFTPGDGRQLSQGAKIVPSGPVYFDSYTVTDSGKCIGVGIWTPATGATADPDLTNCPGDSSGCNLLVVLEDDSVLSGPNIVIDDCASGPNTVRLRLQPPQPVLGFKFWDNDEGGSSFEWTNNGGGSGSVNIPGTNNNQGTSVDISSENPAPDNVQYVEITYGGSGGFQSLTLCRKKGGDVIGDPHIHTFEGQRYLLLNQGNFDLWHISGLQTNFMAQNLMKTVDINWQFYTHYSGSTSFTKGLLLVDKSGGKLRQMAELTSKDCKWHTKLPGGDWEVVKESKLFSSQDGDTFVTGMKLGLETQHLKLSMNTPNGKTNVAGVFWSCRPGHHINLRVHMMRDGANDEQYVHGEVRGLSHRKVKPDASMLQSASGTELQMTDDEFSVKRTWQQLGGSNSAAQYLEAVDEHGPISHFLASCSAAEKAEATKICAKHLGEAGDSDFFQDCVTDVCNGSGEVAAELAAELREVSRKADD